MPLRPDDVVRTSFTMSRLRQGYDIGEVDAFLDEVVDELKRLHARIDELEAAAMRSRDQDDPGDSDRVRLERQQLELIRREREDLVEELRQLQGTADTVVDGDHPHEQPHNLERQVSELQDELSTVRQQHRELQERMLAMVHDQLRVLQEGRGQAAFDRAAGDPEVR